MYENSNPHPGFSFHPPLAKHPERAFPFFENGGGQGGGIIERTFPFQQVKTYDLQTYSSLYSHGRPARSD